MKKLENGQCYKHNKLKVFKKITDANERYCIRIELADDHKEISTSLFL